MKSVLMVLACYFHIGGASGRLIIRNDAAQPVTAWAVNNGLAMNSTDVPANSWRYVGGWWPGDQAIGVDSNGNTICSY